MAAKKTANRDIEGGEKIWKEVNSHNRELGEGVWVRLKFILERGYGNSNWIRKDSLFNLLFPFAISSFSFFPPLLYINAVEMKYQFVYMYSVRSINSAL